MYMGYKSHYPSSLCRKSKRMCLLYSRKQEGLSWWLSGKESACNAGNKGDLSSIPEQGRSPGRGHGNPLQYSCLENPIDRGAWRATVHGVAELDATEAT